MTGAEAVLLVSVGLCAWALVLRRQAAKDRAEAARERRSAKVELVVARATRATMRLEMVRHGYMPPPDTSCSRPEVKA